ncbi:MAG: tetratricopeptide repeat protein, partial [Acidobacteria bacterium]|nr:tetratricopeptide repeat protein [Acidobacteriota bacterium]
MAFNKAKSLKEAEKYTAQNKVSAAIRKYEEILKRDRSDLSLLNTLGDLYVRDKKVPKAIEYFNQLGDAYMKEGFNLKGIAILRKVLKLDPESPTAHAKLAELYTLQGLTSEARPLYLKAANIFLKTNKNEQAIDALYRLVNIEPANANYRTRLADILLQLRRTSEAVGLYGELFDTLVSKKDLAGAKKAVDKIAQAAPRDPRLVSMKARLMIEKGDQEGAIKALSPDGGIPKDPAAQKMLLEAYVATQNLEGAEKLAVESYRATSSDFAPLQNYCKACVKAGDLTRALSPLKELADDIVKNGQGEALAETLKGILTINSEHLGSLELIRKVYTDTQKETALPQILESLGHEYVKFDRKQEAREVYEQLSAIEPHNEDAKNYLNSAGGEAPAAPPSASPAMETAMGSAIAPTPEMAFGLEATPAAATPPAEGETLDAFTTEAFQNADLYAGYLKVDKAIEELEKVLARHPGHILANEKLVEVCFPSNLDRAGQAAQALQDLYQQQGDAANSAKYGELAQKYSQQGSSPPPAAGSEKGFEISGSGAIPEVAEPAAAPPAGGEAPGFESSGPGAIPGVPEPAAAPPAGDEADLSADMGEMFGDEP